MSDDRCPGCGRRVYGVAVFVDQLGSESELYHEWCFAEEFGPERGGVTDRVKLTLIDEETGERRVVHVGEEGIRERLRAMGHDPDDPASADLLAGLRRQHGVLLPTLVPAKGDDPGGDLDDPDDQDDLDLEDDEDHEAPPPPAPRTKKRRASPSAVRAPLGWERTSPKLKRKVDPKLEALLDLAEDESTEDDW